MRSKGAYHPALKAMHWTMAGGAIACITTVLAAQQTTKTSQPLGLGKAQLMHIHKSIGLTMLPLIAARVGLKLMTRAPAHIPGPAIVKVAGAASHAAFYFLMVFMPASGVAMGYYGGKGLPFFGMTIPGAKTPDKAVGGAAYVWHKRAGTMLEYLVPLHVGAVGYHTATGTKILSRML